MALFETVIDAFGNLSVGGVTLYSLADVGVILAVGAGVFLFGKYLLDKAKK